MIAPTQRMEPETDRRKLEAQAKKLAEMIDKAQRNLVHIDADNIPTAQQEISRLKGERSELEVELRKKPPTEADINSEVMAVLNMLWA